MECVFCRLHRDGAPHVVHRSQGFVIVPDRDSLGFGHCVIIPSQHVAKVYVLEDETYRRLFGLAKLLSVRLERITGRKAVAYTAFGTGLPHAHLHVVPHDDIDVLINPTRYLTTLSPEELTSAAQQLKEHIDDLAVPS